MPEPSIVYVNGTCLNSGFVGAVAGIGIYFENHALRPYDLSEEMPFHVIRRNGGGLNQDMAELYAVLRGIQQALVVGLDTFVIRTQSVYAADMYNFGRHRKSDDTWYNHDGTPAMYQALIAELDEEAPPHGCRVEVPSQLSFSLLEGQEEAKKLAIKGCSF